MLAAVAKVEKNNLSKLALLETPLWTVCKETVAAIGHRDAFQKRWLKLTDM